MGLPQGCVLLIHPELTPMFMTSLVSGTRKYDRGLSQILRYMPTCTGSMWQIGSGTSLVLHSTDVSTTKRAVSGRLLRCSLRHRQSSATTFRTSLLADRTTPRRSTLCRRAFSFTGTTVWNLLRDQLRDSDCTESTFRQSLNTSFFNQY